MPDTGTLISEWRTADRPFSTPCNGQHLITHILASLLPFKLVENLHHAEHCPSCRAGKIQIFRRRDKSFPLSEKFGKNVYSVPQTTSHTGQFIDNHGIPFRSTLFQFLHNQTKLRSMGILAAGKLIKILSDNLSAMEFHIITAILQLH